MKLTIKELEKLESALSREVKSSFDEAMTFDYDSPEWIDGHTEYYPEYKGASSLSDDFDKTTKLYKLLLRVLEEKNRLEKARVENYELSSFVSKVMVEIPKQIRDEGWVFNKETKEYELLDEHLQFLHKFNGEGIWLERNYE